MPGSVASVSFSCASTSASASSSANNNKTNSLYRHHLNCPTVCGSWDSTTQQKSNLTFCFFLFFCCADIKRTSASTGNFRFLLLDEQLLRSVTHEGTKVIEPIKMAANCGRPVEQRRKYATHEQTTSSSDKMFLEITSYSFFKRSSLNLKAH